MNPGTVAHQVPLFMGFSRQEYQGGLPCPPPGDLPDPGIEPESLMSPASHISASYGAQIHSGIHYRDELNWKLLQGLTLYNSMAT